MASRVKKSGVPAKAGIMTMAIPASRNNTANTFSVLKNRSATIPTKKGATIQAMGPNENASGI